jgi:hypothetical protein
MKIEIKSDKTKTIDYRTRKIKVDKFIVVEQYANDVLTSQTWNIKGGFKITHPEAYESHNLRFAYYENIDFLKSNSCVNYDNFDDEIPDPTLIINWNNFTKLDNVLCDWLGMDGNIYRITDPKPIALWRRQDYISSFSNDEYDLGVVVKILKKKRWIRNIKIVDIPYYNRYNGETNAVEFDYKLPSKKDLDIRLKKEPMFKDHYFGV